MRQWSYESDEERVIRIRDWYENNESFKVWFNLTVNELEREKFLRIKIAKIEIWGESIDLRF